MRKLTLGLRLNQIGSGSRVLALIFYQDTLKNFVYDTDASGNAILTNKGSGEDGLLYTGRGLELGADNDLPIEIAHTLGSDTKQTATLGSGWVDNGSHSYTAATATSALSTLTSSTTDNVQIDFTISNYTAGDVEGFDANGTYTINTTDASLDATGFSGDVLINSVKEITNPNSHLTIVNGDGSVEQIYNSLAPSTHYTFNNQTILEVMPTTAPFTIADLALIQADTTLLARLALGEDNAGGLSLVTADVFGWYPMTENDGAYVVDATSVGEQKINNGTFDTNTNWGTPINGWSIVDGELVGTVISGNLSNDNLSSVAGETYLVSIENTEINTEGAIRFKYGTSDYFSTPETVGTHKVLVTATANNEGFRIFRQLDKTLKMDNIYVKRVIASTITNYIASIRENVDQNQKGLQTTCLELDGAGVPTAVDFTKLHWYGVGYGDTQFNPSLYSEFIIEENVGAIFYSHIYDGVNLTTWTDGVEGTPTAHSPENADYLLGKSVYPKVAADPYTIYTQDWFKTIDNAAQIAEYDGLQAYNDWAGI